jgi:hypothetical protein
MLAVLVYLAAAAIPVYLLYHFHACSWYWHVLAIAAGISLGFIPIPPEYQRRGFDLLLGFSLVVLLFWGIGGLITPHHHREKHA